MIRIARHLTPFLSSFSKEDKGAAAVEFAMILPVLIMMIFGSLETGRVLHNKATLQRGVEVAARYAMVHQTATQTDLQTEAFGAYAPKGDGGSTPTIALSTVTVSGVDFMVITATLDHTMLIPLINTIKLKLSAESRVPLE